MADEVTTKNTTTSPKVPTPSPVTTSKKMKKQGPDANQFRDAFDQRKNEFQTNIGDTMDNSLNTQKQSLQNAYNQNMAGQTQAMNAGQQAFEASNRDLGVQAARTQTAMDNYADVRGLNRQPGSQQSLSLGLGRSVAAGKLAQQQQLALQESQRQQELLKMNYQGQISKAVAENDYRRAAALMDDYNNQNNWLDKNAARLASFGNFTGYEQLYGPDTATMMRQFWVGSNPELAYNTGAISAERYERMTGRKAPDKLGVPTDATAGGGYAGGINADWYTNGRPVWTAEHGGWGPSIGGGDEVGSEDLQYG